MTPWGLLLSLLAVAGLTGLNVGLRRRLRRRDRPPRDRGSRDS